MQRRGREGLFYPADQPMSGLPFWEHHAHSDFSDGETGVPEVMAMARSMGIGRLIFTEHTEPELVAGPGWYREYVESVSSLREVMAGEMEVVIGLEVPLLDFSGRLQIDAEMEASVEFVLGAVHAYPGHGWEMSGMAPERAIELEFRSLMVLAAHPLVDAIAHPGGVCHKYVTPFPLTLFEEVVRCAVVHGKAIELNPAYHEPMAPYLEICRRHGALISPGSNAHHPEAVGQAWKVLSHL